ncbi:choice-of-anchor D domain-containing protein [Luteolibacter sp. Populi]|uniref:choice-of-anchor D domain-containing protein n=1 Tax=Luteolibacter sp. Populi TaxID=3230487 RepID=UPI00346752EF
MQSIFHHLPSVSTTGQILVCVAACGVMRAAPIPYSLENTFVSPATARQLNTWLGHSVAVDGTYAVIASPFDDTGGEDSGIVGVYNATTGALIHSLANPEPFVQSRFGWSVAVSGNWVVVGVKDDDTGAEDTGIAYVYDMASVTPAIPAYVLGNPDPGENDSFGYSVAIAGNRVVVGAPDGDVEDADAGTAYVYDLASGTPEQPLVTLANPLASGQNFGWSVAISGTRVVIGSPQDSGTGDLSRAYVYDVSSGTPQTPEASYADATPASNERFGWSVAASGTRVAVAAPHHDTGADNAGACYLYDFSSGTPASPTATVLNPAALLADEFGFSISLSDTRLAVGNHLDDQSGADAGRVYVFDVSSGSPAILATLDNPTPQSGDNFGRSVSISGTRLATGAHGDNTGGSDVGSAYVFDFSGAPPSAPVLTINTPSISSEEEFATAIALWGSIVVIGAHHDDKGGNPNCGTVFIYDRLSPNPTQPVLTIDNPAPNLNDYFGAAVAINGNTVVVAAYQDDVPATNCGIVYVYDRSSPTPGTPVLTIQNPAAGNGDQFGNTIALSGTRLVVGCSRNDPGVAPNTVSDAGSVYVYDLNSGTPTVPVAILDNPAPHIEDVFGYAVAISGTNVLVGAYNNDSGAPNSGSAYLYDISSGTPAVPVAVFDNPAPTTDDFFGHAVALSVQWAVVGAHMNDSGARDAGSAYVYALADLPATAPNVILHNPAPEPEDAFAFSVAIDGSRIVIGGPEIDNGAPDAGGVYVYDMTSSTPAVAVDILDCLDHRTGDFFGFNVAVQDNNIVVGAPLDDGTSFDRGAAYYFDPDPPAPQMQVEQPPGTGLIGGSASIHFGNSPVNVEGGSQTVTVRNVGTAALQLSSITLLSGNTLDFVVDTPSLPLTLPVDQTATFDVTFSPLAVGSRLALLRITSNAASNSPFDVTLTGQSLASDHDTDGDGLNDVLELRLAALGFDWQVNDEELIAILQSGANVTGVYSVAQLQAMHPGMPLAPVDPETGDFTLTVAVKKSTDLSNFALLPVITGQAVVNGQGKLEFNFAAPEQQAFYLLDPR